MRKSGKLPWSKLYAESAKNLLNPQLSDAAKITWILLQPIFNRCEPEGYLMSDGEPIELERLAAQLWKPTDRLKKELNELLKFGLIEESEGVIFDPWMISDKDRKDSSPKEQPSPNDDSLLSKESDPNITDKKKTKKKTKTFSESTNSKTREETSSALRTDGEASDGLASDIDLGTEEKSASADAADFSSNSRNGNVPSEPFAWDEIDRGAFGYEEPEDSVPYSDMAAALSLILGWILASPSLAHCGGRAAALLALIDPTNEPPRCWGAR